ncbi:MAG: hypothetical protein JJU08_02585 [Rhodobacteraceae bacterium]|nr:hypothetical protein [Paracoccaceae bacterium]
MRLIWLSGVCGAIVVVLLVLGERTLPLFGGDRDLAARIYKTLFTLLISSIAAGLIPTVFGRVARFGRNRLAETNAPFRLVRRFLPVLEIAGPWLAGAIALSGVVMAAYIWMNA